MAAGEFVVVAQLRDDHEALKRDFGAIVRYLNEWKNARPDTNKNWPNEIPENKILERYPKG